MGKTTYLRSRAGLLRAGSIVGSPVESVSGERLGQIEDLMVDALQWRAAFAVLSTDSIPHLSGKLFAVPITAFSYRQDDRSFILHVGKDTLERASGFAKEQWPDMNDRAWAEEIHAHYGCPPYWE
jgi:hypothetical protein